MKNLEHYLTLKYPIELVEDEDGRFVASIPDLPGCASFGDSPNEAIEGLRVTKELWVKGRLENGLEVPEPTELEDFSGKFVLRIPRSLHKSLDFEASSQGVSLNHYVSHLLSERHQTSLLKDVVRSLFSQVFVSKMVWSSGERKWGTRPIDLKQSTHPDLGFVRIIGKPKKQFTFATKLVDPYRHCDS